VRARESPMRLCRGIAKPDSEARFCMSQKGAAGEDCAGKLGRS
jgi:hypothetical protein